MRATVKSHQSKNAVGAPENRRSHEADPEERQVIKGFIL